jgi:hypothetical protein
MTHFSVPVAARALPGGGVPIGEDSHQLNSSVAAPRARGTARTADRRTTQHVVVTQFADSYNGL